MHVITDWILKDSSNAVAIHHNSDWSGDVIVTFNCRSCDGHREKLRVQWTIGGRALLDGSVRDFCLALDDVKHRTHLVPASVIARAVVLANRSWLSTKVIRFGEDLL